MIMANYKQKFNERFYHLAMKYYGTTDLGKLSTTQIDKLTNWVTNTDPNTKARQKGRKYSGNTYKKLKGIYN